MTARTLKESHVARFHAILVALSPGWLAASFVPEWEAVVCAHRCQLGNPHCARACAHCARAPASVSLDIERCFARSRAIRSPLRGHCLSTLDQPEAREDAQTSKVAMPHHATSNCCPASPVAVQTKGIACSQQSTRDARANDPLVLTTAQTWPVPDHVLLLCCPAAPSRPAGMACRQADSRVTYPLWRFSTPATDWHRLAEPAV
ncbi:hypothetical protein BD289DRAFT_28012 [Coniella lustricola]|uniref:RanBP2-type domain-containing protein n=1 Tax=Coniella lustricola TaxID=2025994 RepID=A0A2T3AIW3_9PEZI|nr:hypothetical protein BD289DRAFT_28012 [Coniella lustricola]